MITRMQINIHGHLKFSQRWNEDQIIFLQKVMILKIIGFVSLAHTHAHVTRVCSTLYSVLFFVFRLYLHTLIYMISFGLLLSSK